MNTHNRKEKINKGFIWKDYYFVITPLIVTILVYLPSLFFSFRNFDEDNFIKDFYMQKTLGEYIDKFLFLHTGGVSEAHGFTFSGIQNIHVCILGLPSIYLTNFIFQAQPFFYHALGLFFHCSALFLFIWLCFHFTQNKQVAMFAGLIWSLLPTNVEPVIWATNWLQPFGTTLYFYTLSKIISLARKGLLQEISTSIFVLLITIIQILFTEHTITIPFGILFTTLYFLKSSSKESNIIKRAIQVSAPSFIVIAVYWLVRTSLISKAVVSSTQNTLYQTLERILFFTPQIFIHQLKLIFIPLKLSIDQIDLLSLDKTYLGPYNLFCIFLIILFILLIFSSRNRLPILSFGFLLYLIAILPFIQIVPLYSLAGERYNYLGSAFITFGIVGTLFNIKGREKIFLLILITTSLIFSTRSVLRIYDWKDSNSLFVSTIKTSKSLYKKGIWTYNLAICKKDLDIELIKRSNLLLKKFVQKSIQPKSEPNIFKIYDLDYKSIIAKSLIRIATNYELLKKKEMQLTYLLKALEYSKPQSQISSLIYKNLGTLYFQTGNLTKAIYFYNQSCSISPTAKLKFAIAICYLKLNDFINYERYLQEAVSMNSSDGEIYKAYGQLLELSKHDYQNATKYYRISSFLLKSPEPYILLTTLYLKLKDIDNAFEILNKGLYGFPKNPILVYLHSTVLINKGEVESGLKELKTVTEDLNTPNDIKIESCIILSNMFLRQHNLQEAKRYNDLVLTLDPKNQDALKNNSLLMGCVKNSRIRSICHCKE